MAIKVYWDDEQQTIIRWDLPDHWTITDLYDAADRSLKLRKTQPSARRVYRIIYALPNSTIPVGVLTHVRNVALKMEGDDRVIRVGGSPLQRMMDRIFIQAFKVFGDRIFYADTLEQARALIVHLEQTTPKS